jgi:hypothetical protein
MTYLLAVWSRVRRIPWRVWLWIGLFVVAYALGAWDHDRWHRQQVQTVTACAVTTHTVSAPSLDARTVAPLAAPVAVARVQAAASAGRRVEAVAQATGRVTVGVPPADGGAQTVSRPIEAVAVFSRDGQGQPAASLDLFSVAQDGTRSPLADAKTIIVLPTPAAPRWRLGWAVQAGGGYAMTTDGSPSPYAAVLLPWLRKGTSRAAEDAAWAVATPGVLVTTKSVEPGLAPVSWNLGRLKGNPLKDTWLSPWVGWDVKGSKLGHVGVLLTATF